MWAHDEIVGRFFRNTLHGVAGAQSKFTGEDLGIIIDAISAASTTTLGSIR